MKIRPTLLSLPTLTLVLALAGPIEATDGNIHYPSLPPAVGATMPGVLFGQAIEALKDEGTAETPRSEEPEGSGVEAIPEDPVEFLRRLEEKNAGLKSLHSKFLQVRSSSIFLEKIESRGEFWYQHPSLFRCDYYEPSELRYYLIKNTAYIYTPELNQVDEATMDSGDGAAINQLLVGFGLDVDLILEVFDVNYAHQQPANDDRLAVDFVSKDLDRSLGYSSIRVEFDRESLDPKLLEMEQEDETVTVRLESVVRDVEIDPVKFKAEFPPTVEINRL
jgi:outer membrane lipoprotein-sorting protein